MPKKEKTIVLSLTDGFVRVPARRFFNAMGHTFALHHVWRDEDTDSWPASWWKISEVSTGFAVGLANRTMQSAIEDFNAFILPRGEEKMAQSVARAREALPKLLAKCGLESQDQVQGRVYFKGAA